MNKTKIICTLGPASSNEKTIEKLIIAGMDIARLNFSHGDYQKHLEIIQTIRKVSKKLNKFIPIMQDLQGPKIRVGKLIDGKISAEEGSEIFILRKKISGKGKKFSTSYAKLVDDVKNNDVILIDDGLIQLKVIEKKYEFLKCKVIKGGIVLENKGINLPDTNLSLPSLTNKDKRDLLFGIKHGIDAVALSFVRHAKDITELRKLIENLKRRIPIIAKIERPEALNEIENIINISDVIMIARGDLGVEISAEEVPILQKKIIKMCNSKLKPVITATQMLESMVNNRIPTRAETTDVANAILDGTDCVMLSAETSIGSDPVNVVSTMENIIRMAENYRKPNLGLDKEIEIKSELFQICKSAVQLAKDINIKYVITFTRTGKSPVFLSSYRVNTDIFSFTNDKFILTINSFTWGVVGILIPDKIEFSSLKFLKIIFRKFKIIKKSRIIILSSSQKNLKKSADTIQILSV